MIDAQTAVKLAMLPKDACVKLNTIHTTQEEADHDYFDGWWHLSSFSTSDHPVMFVWFEDNLYYNYKENLLAVDKNPPGSVLHWLALVGHPAWV